MVAIAEQINTSLKTVTDWTDQYTSTFGIVFRKVQPRILDSAITRYADAGEWVKVMTIKRKAEIVGYSSPTIDEKTKLALTNITMFTTGKLPQIEAGWWWNWFYCTLNGFRWAKELNHETNKWDDPTSAFNALARVRTAQEKVFYRCNPDTGEVTRMFGGRWHQVGALAGTFLKFHELGVRDALLMAAYEWKFLNEVYWKLSKTYGNHYIYAPEWEDWEVRNPDVFQTFTKALKVAPEHFSINFPRIIDDVSARYLSYKWVSPQWGGYNVVVHHFPGNLERRLDGTLGAWIILHMFYRRFTDPIKSNMRDMLLGRGVVKASDALLASDLFDPASNRFRGTSTWGFSDRATCFGCAALLLMAIVPETGCLAIPIHAEGMEMYEFECLNPTHFEFNYEAKQIKIPVYAGKLKFTFGTKEVEAKFPYDGIYRVTFSSDWNQIIDVARVGDLEAVYLDPPKPLPTLTEAMFANFAQTLAVLPITALSRTTLKKVKEITGR